MVINPASFSLTYKTMKNRYTKLTLCNGNPVYIRSLFMIDSMAIDLVADRKVCVLSHMGRVVQVLETPQEILKLMEVEEV